ncbi:PQQ-dependent sugar dehydrogenase [Ornithinimicrobium cerasi]|uniref:Glucose/arabinose dehydrogenase, beta-propeller fold n=1 Tax=Ornithinimicrobium cerasi TaxID=2248773 RepID=A0A285VTD2_9MICO|nr:PQQ-dependent sugar dehydrogenase [Ornithinimicrobium cerasi]SOC57344.1 Glucose/arabinose dehydrogenase, beta-propeller fold [Ornithinimicrobium cerasi]
MRLPRPVVVPALLSLTLLGCSVGTDAEVPGYGASPASAPATGSPDDGGDGATEDGEEGPTEDGAPEDGTSSAPATSAPDDAPSDEAPALDVEVVADGLALPWDVQLLPDGTALVTERGGRLLAIDPDGGAVRELDLDMDGLFVGSEAGLMGLAVSPTFEEDRSVLVCHAAQPTGEAPDVRVTRLRLDEAVTRASVDTTLVTGLPLSSGRHSGCRLLVTGDGTLLVGTGDAAVGTHPQDLGSLGGKVLALTLEGGPADPDGHVEGADPRVLTYGHRNVQGLAEQPGTGTVWAVEHGPDVDDEVNVLVPGGNYGWDPVPGYDESVPMTDLEAFPDAVEAAWSSGAPTHATSGAVFLEGEQWGAWAGALAIAELKGSGVTVLTVDGTTVVAEERVPELDGTHGRLRSLTLDDEGALWVTSSDGEDDVVLRVTPSP